jgi:hypothetical protein
MVKTQKRIQRQAIKITVAASALVCFGAVVMAAPFAFATRARLLGDTGTSQSVKLAPLAVGPAVQLARAGTGEDEDCVRVTKMTGPDGKVYPTRGVVCGGAD